MRLWLCWVRRRIRSTRSCSARRACHAGGRWPTYLAPESPCVLPEHSVSSRSTLRTLIILEREPDMIVVGQAGTLVEARRMLQAALAREDVRCCMRWRRGGRRGRRAHNTGPPSTATFDTLSIQ